MDSVDTGTGKTLGMGSGEWNAHRTDFSLYMRMDTGR
jgi:hypothetical protein